VGVSVVAAGGVQFSVFRSFRRLLKTHWFTADHSAM